ncbi:unnamed protein product [Symbiodinium sp. CCMP2592]|nr:unnamed protein product [Symbiodinium sp. CCMP2592]
MVQKRPSATPDSRQLFEIPWMLCLPTVALLYALVQLHYWGVNNTNDTLCKNMNALAVSAFSFAVRRNLDEVKPQLEGFSKKIAEWWSACKSFVPSFLAQMELCVQIADPTTKACGRVPINLSVVPRVLCLLGAGITLFFFLRKTTTLTERHKVARTMIVICCAFFNLTWAGLAFVDDVVCMDISDSREALCHSIVLLLALMGFACLPQHLCAWEASLPHWACWVSLWALGMILSFWHAAIIVRHMSWMHVRMSFLCWFVVIIVVPLGLYALDKREDEDSAMQPLIKPEAFAEP